MCIHDVCQRLCAYVNQTRVWVLCVRCMYVCTYVCMYAICEIIVRAAETVCIHDVCQCLCVYVNQTRVRVLFFTCMYVCMYACMHPAKLFCGSKMLSFDQEIVRTYTFSDAHLYMICMYACIHFLTPTSLCTCAKAQEIKASISLRAPERPSYLRYSTHIHTYIYQCTCIYMCVYMP